MHAEKALESSEQRSVEPSWFAEKWKVISVPSVCASAPMSGSTESMVVSGGSMTVQLRLAGVVSTFPKLSMARTLNSWAPAVTFVSSTGDEQELNVSVSMAHSKLEPGSVEENAKFAFVLAVIGCGPESIMVSAGRSTVHVRLASVGSV